MWCGEIITDNALYFQDVIAVIVLLALWDEEDRYQFHHVLLRVLGECLKVYILRCGEIVHSCCDVELLSA